MRRSLSTLMLLVCGCLIGQASAQSNVEIEDEQIDSGARTPLTSRDAPNIVTVFGRDEIVRSGARDLLDLLLMVPGFFPAIDVEGVVGLGFRGQWGHEGKILLLVDGQEFNETLYGTTPMPFRLPAMLLERVEVIRGPGSATYGGFAGLAVINISTRSSRTLDGAAASVEYGHLERGYGHTSVVASGTTSQLLRGSSASVSVAYLNGNVSDRTYTDFSNQRYDMLKASRVGTFHLNAAFAYRGLRVRFVFEDHTLTLQSGTGRVEPFVDHERFRSYFGELAYTLRPRPSMTLQLRNTIKSHTPWQVENESSELYYDKTALRWRLSAILTWQPRDFVLWTLGADGYWDHARVNSSAVVGLQTLFGDSRTFDLGNIAVFTNLLLRTRIVNVTAGARFEWNSAYGPSFVPRVGLTRVWKRANVKLLYSMAFRSPVIENITLNPTIRPEQTHVVEAEAGFQPTGHITLGVNAYFILINRPIVYQYDQARMQEVYTNAQRTGSAGLEALVRMKYSWGYATATYSYYNAAGLNRVDAYAVFEDKSLLRGLPGHKLTLQSSFQLWKEKVYWSVSGVYFSERYGALAGAPDGSGAGLDGRDQGRFLLNTMLTYRGLFTKDLHVSLGATNLLGTPFRLLQPYAGDHAPYSLGSREVMVRVTYGAWD